MAREPAKPEPPMELATFRAETCTPSEVERLIDVRVGQVQSEIAQHRAQIEELTAEQKRWLAVTGGRSRLNGDADA